MLDQAFFPPACAVATETTLEIIPEITTHIRDHWNELGEEKEKYDLDVDWIFYHRLYEQNRAHVTTARDYWSRELVGYHVVAVVRHTHRNQLCAGDLVSFVSPHEPRRAWVLLRMYRHSVAALSARGINHFRFRSKDYKSLQPLMKRLGFHPVETVYAMTMKGLTNVSDPPAHG